MAHGGADSKMKKFPRIIDYLEVHEKGVYALLNRLSMTNALNPRRGGAITFLVPDAEYVKALNKIVEGPNPEEATNIISALILTIHLPDIAAFNKYQKDIPNMLGKKLVVKAITAKGVEVDNGVLTLDEKFQPFSHVGGVPRNNMSVWKLKGKINTDTPKATYENGKEAKKGAKRGGFEGQQSTPLAQLRTRLQLAKVAFVREGPANGVVGEHCPLLQANARLIRGFQKDPAMFKEELCMAHCILTCEPTIDFLLLFCNPLMFMPDRVMQAYNNSADLPGNAVVDFCGGKCQDDGSGAILLTKDGCADFCSALSKVVEDLLATSNTTNIVGRVKKLYDDADLRNRLVNPISDQVMLKDKAVYPEALSRAFSTNVGLHQLLDEIKCKVYTCLRSMVNEQKLHGKDPADPERRAFRAKSYDELFRWVDACYRGELTGGVSACFFSKQDTFEVMSESMALPEAFKVFATCCMLCRHDLSVKGAGKRRRKVRRGGDEDDSDEELDNNDVSEAQEEISSLARETGDSSSGDTAVEVLISQVRLLSPSEQSKVAEALSRSP